MNRPLNQFYEFGPFRLDPAEHLLLRDGQPLPLRPKVFDILLVLIENRGHLIEKDELMQKIWPQQFVEEGNLNKNISMLRQALGDGSEQRQLTSGAGLKRTPIVSPDGRYIVFASDADGPLHLWRMELDGSKSIQLTKGEGGENYPCFSPDGRWVVYTQVKDWTLWKVPFDGGAPVRLTDTFSKGPSVSPDGKLLAYYYREKEPDAKWKIMVSTFSDASSFKVFDVPRSDFQSLNIVWTPDGRALTYEAVNEGVSNIWRQPLDGGRPVQLTDFNSDYISYFAWSADGKRLACIRGGWAQDIVLITDFR